MSVDRKAIIEKKLPKDFFSETPSDSELDPLQLQLAAKKIERAVKNNNKNHILIYEEADS
ncbi:hypothetical protein [Algicola sagamiensis]|uniref:hypothetical protein n=1 Tax=Algicola sagamiensis TaxID=163869 RepID=UPI00037A5350|nr:hypothetical protein [Algicola sagamiensis]